MAIPQSFRKKYSLEGENYDKQDVEAALSALYAMSTRLYSENTDLRRELDELKEKSESETSVAERLDAVAEVLESLSADNNEIMARLDDIEMKLDGITANASAGIVCDDGADVLAQMKEIDMSSDYDGSDEPEAEDDTEMEIELYEIPADAGTDADAGNGNDTAEGESADTAEVGDVTEIAEDAGIPTVTDSHDDEGPDDSDIADQLRLAILGGTFAGETAAEDDNASENAAAEIGAADDKSASDSEADSETEYIPEENDIKTDAEADTADGTASCEEEPSREQMISAAGLDTDPVEEEPAAPVSEDSITRMLAALYNKPADTASEAEKTVTGTAAETVSVDENTKKEEKTSVSDMRSSLDAIRRRLGKK